MYEGRYAYCSVIVDKKFSSTICISKSVFISKCIFPKCIHPKCIFVKCTRLACLLSFASLFSYWTSWSRFMIMIWLCNVVCDCVSQWLNHWKGHIYVELFETACFLDDNKREQRQQCGHSVRGSGSGKKIRDGFEKNVLEKLCETQKASCVSDG